MFPWQSILAANRLRGRLVGANGPGDASRAPVLLDIAVSPQRPLFLLQLSSLCDLALPIALRNSKQTVQSKLAFISLAV